MGCSDNQCGVVENCRGRNENGSGGDRRVAMEMRAKHLDTEGRLIIERAKWNCRKGRKKWEENNTRGDLVKSVGLWVGVLFVGVRCLWVCAVVGECAWVKDLEQTDLLNIPLWRRWILGTKIISSNPHFLWNFILYIQNFLDNLVYYWLFWLL